MAGLPNYFISSLNQTLTVGGNDTSISLSTIYTQDGQVVNTADFARYGRGIITINPISLSAVEFASFTGITATTSPTGTLTGCLRGLSFKGNNQIAANQKFNVVGVPVIISFGTHNLLDIPALVADNTFTGLNTFSQFPITPSSAPTTNYQVANKKYVDDTAIAGAPKATDSVYGITRLSVAAVSATIPIAVGDNDTRVPTTGEALALVGNNTDVAVGTGNKYVTQTGLQHNAEKFFLVTSASTTAYVATLSPVPTSLTDGMLVYIKMDVANSTTTPTLNVNGLGAKTIVKLAGTALAVSDIAANMYCTFMYDLGNTRWVMQNPIANASTFVGTFKQGVGTRSATGTQTVTHGGSTIPKRILISASGNGGGNSLVITAAMSWGTYDSSGQSCAYIGQTNTNPTQNQSGTSATGAVYVIYANTAQSAASDLLGIIGNVTATTFDIVWSAPNGAGAASIAYNFSIEY